jgi:sec-independent protein translocase protein TatA
MFEGLFQPMHLVLILIICIFLFGPKKLPELGKALGDGIRGFKDGMNPQTPPAAKSEDTKTAENVQTK